GARACWKRGVSKSVVLLTGDRGFESISLQRRVRSEPCPATMSRGRRPNLGQNRKLALAIIGSCSHYLQVSSAPPRALILLILWRTRIRGRPLRFAGDWKLPAAANCHEPEREAENRAGNRHCGRRKPQRGADHDHGRAGQGGNGVKIGAQ